MPNLDYQDEELHYDFGSVNIDYDDENTVRISIKSKWGGASINVKFDPQFARTEVVTRQIASTFKVLP